MSQKSINDFGLAASDVGLNMKPSKRLQKLPPYLFADLDRQKARVRAMGKDIIDLSIGDPDLEPPHSLVEALAAALHDRRVHRYPDYSGSLEFRKSAAQWLARRHNAHLNPENEVLALIGSKEGLAHLIFAIVNPGEVVLIPSPGYPAYSQATVLAGGVPHFLPVTEENHYIPVFDAIPKTVLKKTRILFLNYPNNPTSAVASGKCFEAALALAREYGFVVCHDAAYLEIHSGTEHPMSILEVPGAKDVAIEFHSFSKTFCVAGWRAGFAAGNANIVGTLGTFKQNMDSGLFTAIQKALVHAMEHLDDHIDGICTIYSSRRNFLSHHLERMGFHVWHSDASFYVWAEIPAKLPSIDFCKKLLEKTAVAATPGIGFGPHGEGFVRFSLTVSTERLEEAATRMAKL